MYFNTPIYQKIPDWTQKNVLVVFYCPDLFAALLNACAIFQPDDIEGKIREIIPAGFTCNTDDFISLLEKEANFKPFGTLLHTYTVHSEEAGELTYQIHKVHT